MELETLSSIIAGVIYGPFFGFFFGFVVWTFIGGLFEIVAWMIVPPYGPATYPFVPSFDTLTDGFLGVVGGLVGTSIPLLFLVFGACVIRNVIQIVKDYVYGWPPKFAYVINILFNVIIVIAFQYYLKAIFNIS